VDDCVQRFKLRFTTLNTFLLYFAQYMIHTNVPYFLQNRHGNFMSLSDL